MTEVRMPTLNIRYDMENNDGSVYRMDVVVYVSEQINYAFDTTLCQMT